jgi:hypothetical protein
MDKKLFITILLSSVFVFSAFKYDGFSYFFLGALVSAGVVLLSLLLACFVKKNSDYYDKNI